MVIEMVKCIVLWINSFPAYMGVSSTIIPKGIITGANLYFKINSNVEFGAYCHTHEENTPTNTIIAWKKGGIFLGPSNNGQGGYKFL